jgi:hypothetical protein
VANENAPTTSFYDGDEIASTPALENTLPARDGHNESVNGYEAGRADYHLRVVQVAVIRP